MNPQLEELKEYLREWLFYFGLVSAFVDGLAIAQAWDWLANSHRLSIWLLL